MADIILPEDIREAYTAKVNEYLARGMKINIGTMSGTQGEIARVDVTDGEYIYRIRLDRDYLKVVDTDEHYFRADTINLTIEKFKDEDYRVLNTFTILWGGKGELVEEKVWYAIDGDRRAFVDNIETVKYFRNLHDARREARERVNQEITDKARLALIYKIIKRRKGYSNVTKKNIQRVVKKDNGRYIVMFTYDSRKDSLYI